MEFDAGRYPGWIVITIARHSAWQIHNVLPMVNTMFGEIKSEYESIGGRLLFNLSELSYFDSTMVSLILRSVSLTGDAKNALIISDDKARDIATLLGLDRLVDLYSSEAEWVRANNDA
jgi:anti-anti-sigma regulatory factor